MAAYLLFIPGGCDVIPQNYKMKVEWMKAPACDLFFHYWTCSFFQILAQRGKFLTLPAFLTSVSSLCIQLSREVWAFSSSCLDIISYLSTKYNSRCSLAFPWGCNSWQCIGIERQVNIIGEPKYGNILHVYLVNVDIFTVFITVNLY